MKWMFAATAALAFFAAPHPAFAQASPQDQKWLQQAHQTNLAEIAAGRLAAQSGHAESVRMVGHTLAADHAELDATLQRVARQLGVKLPEQPNAQQKAIMETLKQQHGMKFDQKWAHDMADGHIQAIELTTFEANRGTAPQVKRLAVEALPVLKKHYQLLTHAESEIHGGP
jgi:putative membrane protein